jgi:hypothetical protein
MTMGFIPSFKAFFFVVAHATSTLSHLGMTTYSYHLSVYQIAVAPSGTQVCTLNIEKFHHTCPVAPDHKPWLVVQGQLGDFFIDHCHPFGAACASSNAGMIANAAVDIWMAEGIKPILKYEDDLNIFHYPLMDGPFRDGAFSYAYDQEEALCHIQSRGVPWQLSIF